MNALKIERKFKINQVVTFLLPNKGIMKGKVINNEYRSLTGNTVVLVVDNHGLLNINEKFLSRIVRS